MDAGLIENHKVKQAYTSFRRIRNTDLEACRDLFYTYVGVEIERRVNTGKSYAARESIRQTASMPPQMSADHVV